MVFFSWQEKCYRFSIWQAEGFDSEKILTGKAIVFPVYITLSFLYQFWVLANYWIFTPEVKIFHIYMFGVSFWGSLFCLRKKKKDSRPYASGIRKSKM